MNYFYKPYVSVAQKEAKAAKKLAQLRKKNPDIAPVTLEGGALAKTWWGKAWNKNLESYADYENRIGRGRSYVRHGAVLDLQIKREKVEALVQGSESNPYSVEVRIEPLKKSVWEKIKAACIGKLDSLPELLEGKFPKALGEVFTEQGAGLFPVPKEIKFSCSCPDIARMCKHVAAALYGIGARLDKDPLLFFTLRGVDVMELISEAVGDRTRNLLDKAGEKSARVLENVDLESMFDIDLEDLSPAPEKPAKVAKVAQTVKVAKTAKEKPKKSGEAKTVKVAKTLKEKPKRSGEARTEKAEKAEKDKAEPGRISEIAKKATPEPAKEKPGASRKSAAEQAPAKAEIANEAYATVAEIVESAIPKGRKGVAVAYIVEKTGFDSTKVYNTLARLKKAGKVENVDRGFYRRKK